MNKYSGYIFHLSENNLDGKTLKPKIPSNFLTDKGYEDNKVKRICFCTTIDGCLMAMSKNIKDKEFYVHIPKEKVKIIIPTTDQVPDTNITNERWVLKDTILKCIGKIKVLEATDTKYEYKYGKHMAELYKWKYKWLEEYKDSEYVKESCKDLATARKFASEVKELAKKYDANFYLVTDRASATNNDGTNDAVKYARDTMKKWETDHGFDAKEDWSKESTVNESYIINQKDILYNKYKFDSDEINLCFITGHSGSGKSSMAHSNESTSVNVTELDKIIWNKTNYSMDYFKKNDILGYTFFSGPGKKYYKHVDELDAAGVDSDSYSKELLSNFISFAKKYSASHKNNKYIVEGTWLYQFEPSLFKDYAVYIKGTSALTSSLRAKKRDNGSIADMLVGLKAEINSNKYIEKFRNYFSKLSNNDSSTNDDVVKESVIIDDDNIFHNKEMWDENECNIIFITGHSGAAKSTTGAKMATESYSLDDVIEQYRFTDENFKEYGDLIYTYFKGPGKKYRMSLDDMKKNTNEKTYEIPILHNFVDYAIKYARSHKNKKFCIEGIQLFQWFEPSEFKDYPVLILGTSVLKSNHRASLRDAQDADNKLQKAVAYTKNILSPKHYINYLDDEKYLKKWRDYYKDDVITEIDRSDIFVEERANPLFVNFNNTKVRPTNTYIDVSIVAKIKDSFVKSFNKDFNKFVDKLYKTYKISKSKFIDDLYIKNNTPAYIYNVDPDNEEQHYYYISIPIYSKELFKKDDMLDTIGLSYDFRFIINNDSIKVNRTDFIIDDDEFEIIKESSITESSDMEESVSTFLDDAISKAEKKSAENKDYKDMMKLDGIRSTNKTLDKVLKKSDKAVSKTLNALDKPASSVNKATNKAIHKTVGSGISFYNKFAKKKMEEEKKREIEAKAGVGVKLAAFSATKIVPLGPVDWMLNLIAVTKVPTSDDPIDKEVQKVVNSAKDNLKSFRNDIKKYATDDKKYASAKDQLRDLERIEGKYEPIAKKLALMMDNLNKKKESTVKHTFRPAYESSYDMEAIYKTLDEILLSSSGTLLESSYDILYDFIYEEDYNENLIIYNVVNHYLNK